MNESRQDVFLGLIVRSGVKSFNRCSLSDSDAPRVSHEDQESFPNKTVGSSCSDGFVKGKFIAKYTPVIDIGEFHNCQPIEKKRLYKMRTCAVFPRFGSKSAPDCVHIDRLIGILRKRGSRAKRTHGL